MWIDEKYMNCQLTKIIICESSWRSRNTWGGEDGIRMKYCSFWNWPNYLTNSEIKIQNFRTHYNERVTHATLVKLENKAFTNFFFGRIRTPTSDKNVGNAVFRTDAFVATTNTNQFVRTTWNVKFVEWQMGFNLKSEIVYRNK